MTKLQNSLESQAYTSQSETKTLYTYPVDIWRYTLPQMLEKDEGGEFQKDLYPEIITHSFQNLTTSVSTEEYGNHMIEETYNTSVEKKEHGEEKETTKKHALVTLLTSILPTTVTKKINTHPITAKQNTKTLPTLIDQLSEEHNNKSEEMESRQEELNTKKLQVSVTTNTNHDQLQFTTRPKPAKLPITQMRQVGDGLRNIVSSFTTAANVQAPESTDPIFQNKVAKGDAASQMILVPKTTNSPVKLPTASRLTAHTQLRLFTFQTTRTAHPQFTETTQTSHTQNTQTMNEPSMIIHQRVSSISKAPITLNQNLTPHPKPTITTTSTLSPSTPEGHSEEEEEKKYSELKTELQDSSQESERNSKKDKHK